MRYDLPVHHDSKIQLDSLCPICDNPVFTYDEAIIIKDEDSVMALAHAGCVSEIEEEDDED